MDERILIFLLSTSFIFLACTDKRQLNNDSQLPAGQHPSKIEGLNPPKINRVAVDTISEPQETAPHTTSHRSSPSNISIEPDYFQQGYDDGYRDGASLEKGRSYDNSLKGKDAQDYRRGYFTGYPDGRADNDPNDEYLTGKNSADYYDTRDDDDWSEDGDFDDDDDGW